jgi:hypothetical protein
MIPNPLEMQTRKMGKSKVRMKAKKQTKTNPDMFMMNIKVPV